MSFAPRLRDVGTLALVRPVRGEGPWREGRRSVTLTIDGEKGTTVTQETRTVRNDIDIIAAARDSDDFRRVLITGQKMQVVVMTIPPGGEIGAETHPETDQVLLFVDGQATSILDGEETVVGEGHLVFVRAGTHHNFVNSGDEPLRIVTAYAPPEHEQGTVHATKAEADADHHH